MPFCPSASTAQCPFLFVCGSCTESNHSAFSRQYVSKNCRGVLDVSWDFYSNRPFCDVAPSRPRSPIQIIKRNVRGVEKTTRSAVGVDLLGLGSLSVSLLHQMLLCPTVFGKPGSTVLRRLTFGELLAAFEVPAQALPSTCPAREVDILTLN